MENEYQFHSVLSNSTFHNVIKHTFKTMNRSSYHYTIKVAKDKDSNILSLNQFIVSNNIVIVRKVQEQCVKKCIKRLVQSKN